MKIRLDRGAATSSPACHCDQTSKAELMLTKAVHVCARLNSGLCTRRKGQQIA